MSLMYSRVQMWSTNGGAVYLPDYIWLFSPFSDADNFQAAVYTDASMKSSYHVHRNLFKTI